MGNKNKTVSFRVNEETFDSLRDIAEERDLSLSAVFRDYVDTFVAQDGRVRVVPENKLQDADADFPPTVEVSKDFLREHERLELEKDYLEVEVEHLREQLAEHKEYIGTLKERLEGGDEDVIYLEDLDEELSDEDTYRLG